MNLNSQQRVSAPTILFLESSKNMGGQEWQLLQQMQALEQRGYQCVLLCPPQARIAEEAAAHQLKSIHLPFRNSAHPPSIQGILKAVRQHQPLACVCHSGHDANNLSLAALLLRSRPKLIRSRTYYTDNKKKTLQAALPMDVVMVPSKFMQSHIQIQFPSKPVKVVYPGVDFEKLDAHMNDGLPADLQQWLVLHQQDDILIQVGMLRPEKGQHITLEALALLLQHRPNVAYMMVGGGNNAALKAKVMALNLQDRVWMGELKNVAPALLAADVLVMPSIKEPLGMAQIEALGLGVPVIVSGVGGIPETVIHQQTGLIVDSHEPLVWQQVIDYALSHKQEMQQQAQQGKQIVRQQFGIAANTEQLLQLIHA